MPKFLDILLGRGDGKILDAVKDTVDELIYSKEEKAKIAQENEEAEFRRENLEREFLQKDVENHLELVKFDIQDKADARSSNIEISKLAPTKVGWLKINMPEILSLAAVLFVYIIFIFVFYTNRDFNQIQRDLLMLLLGAALANYNKVYEFFLGSSSSSKSKDSTIENLTKSKNGERSG